MMPSPIRNACCFKFIQVWALRFKNWRQFLITQVHNTISLNKGQLRKMWDVFSHKLKKAVLKALIMLHYVAVSWGML